MLKTISPDPVVVSIPPSLIERCGLAMKARPFSRCFVCNGGLESYRKVSVETKLLPTTRRYDDTFLCCSSCGKIYRDGPHLKRLKAFVNEVLEH
ncbi:MAG TPA: hypothetical protein ENL07_01690 [Chlorobaculum parvum]|uniref:Mut7-C RNAse domain-containing protein n=1 Tax=Chlorobaculum parvum TaxID=274539 RepID=A0A7C5DFJ4_9CHLB|nr:hypothetical protein [Chlorobaculum parvum]